MDTNQYAKCLRGLKVTKNELINIVNELDGLINGFTCTEDKNILNALGYLAMYDQAECITVLQRYYSTVQNSENIDNRKQIKYDLIKALSQL